MTLYESICDRPKQSVRGKMTQMSLYKWAATEKGQW